RQDHRVHASVDNRPPTLWDHATPPSLLGEKPDRLDCWWVKSGYAIPYHQKYHYEGLRPTKKQNVFPWAICSYPCQFQTESFEQGNRQYHPQRLHPPQSDE